MSGLSQDEEKLLFGALDALKAVENEGSLRRADVDLIWKAIAAELLNAEDTASWARRIAADIVSNVIDDSSSPADRPKRALRALKIIGPEDKNQDEMSALMWILGIEKYLNAFGRFRGLLVDGQYVKFSDNDLLERMKAKGFYSDLSTGNALKRLERLLEKIPEK